MVAVLIVFIWHALAVIDAIYIGLYCCTIGTYTIHGMCFWVRVINAHEPTITIRASSPTRTANIAMEAVHACECSTAAAAAGAAALLAHRI